MSKSLHTALIFLAALAAAALFLGSLKLPLWRLKMEAPQYKDEEALRVRVYPGSMQGDLREISVLNKYIGVRVPERLPQWRWLPPALLSAALLGVVALALPRAARSWSFFASASLLSLLLLGSAALAQRQMHHIGHDRDPHAALKGVGGFTPPLLGEVKVANFEITTGLGSGAALIAAGILLQLGAGLLCRRARPLRGWEEARSGTAPGVRPSSGAATAASQAAPGASHALVDSNVAAPGNGRTPGAVSERTRGKQEPGVAPVHPQPGTVT